jgi:hypothetical protein
MANDASKILSMIKDIKINYIIDYQKGVLYMRSPIFSLAYGIPADAWVSVDLNKMLKSSGMSFADLTGMKYTGKAGFKEIVKDALRSIPLTDKESLSSIYSLSGMIKTIFSDTAFVKNGNTYTNSQTFEVEGASISFKMVLKTSGDQINGYDMTFSVDSKEATMNFNTAMDKDNNATVSMRISVPQLLEMAMNMSFKYEETDKTPASAPEDGSTIVPQPMFP